MVGKLLRQDRGTTRRRGKTGGEGGWEMLRRHGARVSGSMLVRWARSAHRETRRLDWNATLFWRRCPNLDEGRVEVGRYSDNATMTSFVSFASAREKPANAFFWLALRKQRDARIMRQPRGAPLAWSVVAPSIQALACLVVDPCTRRKGDDQQSDL